MTKKYQLSKESISKHMEEDKWMDIRSDYKKGLSYKEIGNKHNIDCKI